MTRASVASRLKVPNHYRVVEETLVDAFDSLTGFAVSGGTTELATIDGITGVKATNTSDAHLKLTKTVSWDFSNMEDILIRFYAAEVGAFSNMVVYVSSSATLSKVFQYTVPSWIKGWNILKIPKKLFTNTGADNWNTVMIRIRFDITPTAGQIGSMTFAGIYKNQRSIPKAILRFDDNVAGIYEIAYPLMAVRGLRGNVWVVPDLVGTSGHATLAHLTTLYGAGWDMCNHGYTASGLTEMTEADALASIVNCVDWLQENSFNSGYNHLVWPESEFNDVVVGIAEDAGMLTAMATSPVKHVDYPIVNPYRLKVSINILPTTTEATIKSCIDAAIACGSTFIPAMHGIMETPSGTFMATSLFTYMIDYLIQQKVDVVTMTEWWNGLTNPRKPIALY